MDSRVDADAAFAILPFQGAYLTSPSLPFMPACFPQTTMRRYGDMVEPTVQRFRLHRNVRAARALVCVLNPVLCSWRFVPRAQRCVRTIISVPSPAASPTAFDIQPFILCPARLLLADDSFAKPRLSCYGIWYFTSRRRIIIVSFRGDITLTRHHCFSSRTVCSICPLV